MCRWNASIYSVLAGFIPFLFERAIGMTGIPSYTLWALGGALLLGGSASLAWERMKQRPSRLEQEGVRELAELRDVGVDIRNRGGALSTDHLSDWVQEVEEWGGRAAEAASKVSVADGAFIRTLNRMPDIHFIGVADQNQMRLLRVMEETLLRIEEILERFRNPGRSLQGNHG